MNLNRAYKIKPNVFYRRMNLDWSQEEALGISGRGLDAKIRDNGIINKYVEHIKFAYTGIDGKIYYICNEVGTGEELLLNADEILVYRQLNLKTAYECLDINILQGILLNTDEILMYRQPDLKTAIQEMLELNSHVVEK